MKKAATTKLAILQKAFQLIYENGYQATSIDDIIATTQVTKGAFFYHFRNKDEMGLAVINEVMYPGMKDAMVSLTRSADPVKDIYTMMRYLLLEDPFLQARYGCPAGNLTQEMAPLNHAFSNALKKLVMQWQKAIQRNVENGKKTGNIRNGVNNLQVAYFVMSGYWGVRNLGKLYSSSKCYTIYLKELQQYLQALK